ncbi:hypothetical protein KL933_004109 [Ogataea haglerorum]|uniref:Tetrapyrrole biosynthesis uroporphyrinogen III synthase domain-containing protein n=1 Tax=Ogataea haglerorum TaxID=1937702 RepID=A0AAN6HZH2_9ASCO|nr:uncharacterized protein KL911_004206 [Ogataea haglerorum]KAG7692958.1 hypothetical protein KL915_004414 [Ogataea haglerorum]KAG7693857.1 hypothetical protein KL951_004336 [Ogataea haglerorum]KAG7704284.1 hypothetical protein KL914_004271 [Ogataea haglerorum]KAG7704469.1 hypothetical protein KL950_004276 [Ogataea haglerorum]KAG7715909.1 hypothetical protein KL913_003722 [Ogataea haglerorum]
MARIILLKNKTVPTDPYDELFSQAQYEPVFLPLLKHSPINEKEVKEFLKSDLYLNEYQALIVTSQRCIETLAKLLQELRHEKFERLDQILSKPSYTVGPTTSQYLENLGFTDVRGGKDAGNGSILSDIIIGDPLYKNQVRAALVDGAAKLVAHLLLSTGNGRHCEYAQGEEAQFPDCVDRPDDGRVPPGERYQAGSGVD